MNLPIFHHISSYFIVQLCFQRIFPVFFSVHLSSNDVSCVFQHLDSSTAPWPARSSFWPRSLAASLRSSWRSSSRSGAPENSPPWNAKPLRPGCVRFSWEAVFFLGKCQGFTMFYHVLPIKPCLCQDFGEVLMMKVEEDPRKMARGGGSQTCCFSVRTLSTRNSWVFAIILGLKAVRASPEQEITSQCFTGGLGWGLEPWGWQNSENP